MIPNNALASRLIRAVKGEGGKRMPPTGALAADMIATLVKWVEIGAPWPDTPTITAKTSGFDLEARKRSHWAWQPVKPQQPPNVKDVG